MQEMSGIIQCLNEEKRKAFPFFLCGCVCANSCISFSKALLSFAGDEIGRDEVFPRFASGSRIIETVLQN